MTDVSLRTEIDCDEDTFWNTCMLAEDFNRSLFLERLKFRRYEVFEQREENGKVVRKQEVEPSLGDLPAPLKKLAGDRLSYVEDGTFDRATKTYSFKVTPSTLRDKTSVQGTMRTEKLDGKRCLRIVDVRIEVKVFAIGGAVEERIAKDLRKSYEATAEFVREYVKTKGL